MMVRCRRCEEIHALNSLEMRIGGRAVVVAALERGRVMGRTARRVVLENAALSGELRLKEPIPCRLEAPGRRVFTVTSGTPNTPLFNAAYSPDDDVAVCFSEGRVVIRGNRFTLQGARCVIEVLPEHYRRTVNPYYRRHDKKRFPRPLVGWLSWYCFFGNFNEKKALKIADFAARHFKPYGLEVIQLENWQKHSWRLPVQHYFHSLTCDPGKFPHGMKYVADQLHARGLKAGLWVVPWGTGDAEVFRKNPEMFLTDRRGEPIVSWPGDYTFDPTHPGSRRWFRKLLRTVTQSWGYDYVKIDGLEYDRPYPTSTYLYMMFRKRRVIRAFHRKVKDPMRSIASLIRRTIGPDIFFVVGAGDPGRTGRFMGVGNAARLGDDVIYEDEDPGWKAVVHTGRVSLRNYHVHNIAWYNDPDVLCVRKPLTRAHARMMCSMIGLTGQHLVLGDILYELTPDRVRMLQQLMPVCDTYPAHLAANDRLQPIWNLVIRRPFEQWNVVGLFNWNRKKAIDLTLRASELGLRRTADYLLFDFWAGTFPGALCGSRLFRLKPQSCRLLAVREKRNRPQLLSIDRHITQGGICVNDMVWDDARQTLRADLDLPRRKTFTATLHVPAGFRLKAVTGRAELMKAARNTATLLVRNGRWQCRFGGEAFQ